MAAQLAPVNGIDIAYERYGDPEAPAVLLVQGFTYQLQEWDQGWVDHLVAAGFQVCRFDNRDVGESSRLPFAATAPDFATAMAKVVGGDPAAAPYVLDDMAADALALMDHLGWSRAHLIGQSMGGMIVQAMAIAAPERVITLTSIYSTTGNPTVGQPTPEAIGAILQRPPADRDGAIAAGIATRRVYGSPPPLFDLETVTAKVTAAYDRSHDVAGVARQMLAIMASPDREPDLKALDLPTLVIHGTDDPLVQPSGGVRTAEVIPGAKLELIEGMGHDLPRPLWDHLLALIVDHLRS